MDCGNDLFDKFLSSPASFDNTENVEYTELQNLGISNNQYSPPLNDSHISPNQEECLMENNYVVSLEEKSKLKELLDGWSMGYLLQTCLCKL